MSVVIVITLEDTECDTQISDSDSRNICDGVAAKIRLSFCVSRYRDNIEADKTNMAARRRVAEEIHQNNSNSDGGKELLGAAEPQGSTRSAIMAILVVFLASSLILGWLYMSFPPLDESEKAHIKLTWDIEELKHIGRILDRYKERYYIEVVALVFLTYIFLQTFAIPGSIGLSVLSGFLFPFPFALLLVCFCSATGASLCYLISSVAGRRLVQRFFPERAAEWATVVKKHKDSILNYIIFLRITPLLPNWFINIVSPCLDVPLFPFWLGTLLGVAPPSVVVIKAGQTLHEMTSADATWSWTSVAALGGCALLSVIPVYFKNKLRSKFE